MTKYGVSVPIYGCATVYVHAESKKEAIEKVESGEYDGLPEIEEWEVSINACHGNVCGRTQYNYLEAWGND